jgi:alanyl aminopeptidase
MHARDIHIRRVVAHAGDREFVVPPEFRVMGEGLASGRLTLRFPALLPAGTLRLVIDYDAPFASGLAGLYRVRQQGLDYAFTQFEATDARSAFPCFDEPGSKTPYDLVLVTPPAMTAVANAPEASKRLLPDGTVAHRFLTTAPLPSYLVAFAVGDFDIVQGRSAPFPIRVVAPKGEGALSASALETAAALVDRLTDYLGVSYPYAKLDLLAVPDFAAGAMENPGLITFRESLLLVDATLASTRLRRAQTLVIAHELAHQWFGDLVTMRWWDDIWLSEGFATWAQAKVVDDWQPGFGAGLDQIARVAAVMDVDALAHARSVREPVRSPGDAAGAFDGITDEKGAAILRMIERWVGPEIFRRAVQKYVRDHAWGTASTDDLFAALDYVSTFNVGQMASGFLDHPGVPEVRASWTCDPLGRSALTLREFTWRAAGSGATAATASESAGRWTVPVCVSDPTQHASSCLTLGTEPVTRELGSHCPAWVYPNAQQSGYYRFTLDAAHLLALAQDERALPPADRAGLIANTWAEVRSGALDPATLLDILARFDGDESRVVVEEIVRVLYEVDRALVEEPARPAFERYARARLASRKAALGWAPAPRGPAGTAADDRALARRAVLTAMGEIVRDTATIAQADDYSVRWLEDPSSVPSDAADVALPISSMGAGAARLRQLRIAASQATTLEGRELALRAMGAFEDPTVLRQALDLVLTPEVRASEIGVVLASALGHRTRRSVVLAWEKDHWADLLRQAPSALGRGFLADGVEALCDAQAAADATEWLLASASEIDGLRRRLEEAIEAAGACAALRLSGAARLSKALSR